MNIVKASGRLVRLDGIVPAFVSINHLGINSLRWIENCARISHRSEETQTPGSWERFIKAVVLDKGDWSVVEHASASVEFVVDRGITHELVRHRLFSFTQESTRFVNYEKKIPASFIQPTKELDTSTEEKESENIEAWHLGIGYCEETYIKLLKAGVSPQIARSVLPNALAAKIMMTGNLRSWRHFFIMRTTKETHPQMKEVTIPLLKEFQQIPLLFDDIEPEKRQIDNLRLPR